MMQCQKQMGFLFRQNFDLPLLKTNHHPLNHHYFHILSELLFRHHHRHRLML